MTSAAQAGAQGHAPTVLIQPIVRKPLTVAMLIKLLETVPQDALVRVESGGVANKLFKNYVYNVEDNSVTVQRIEDAS